MPSELAYMGKPAYLFSTKGNSFMKLSITIFPAIAVPLMAKSLSAREWVDVSGKYKL